MVGVDPPFGQRNYDLVVMEIPQSQYEQGGELVPVSPENNFALSFDQLSKTKQVRLVVSPEIGYVKGMYATITNSPFLMRVREPSTNTVWCVVKPWDMLHDM